MVVQGGDYFGRTVNLAARIAAKASAGQVLVTDHVPEWAPPRGVRFAEVGEAQLKGIPRPVRRALGNRVWKSSMVTQLGRMATRAIG